MISLAAVEEAIDRSGVAPRIEMLLPAGVRRRQLSVRALLAGMCLAQAGHRPAYLTRVHQALTGLSEDDQRRLGVLADWKRRPHLLTYRQTEYTFALVARAVGKDEPDGLASPALQAACDDLLEASVPEEFKDASRSLAVDWTDLESFSRPPPHGTRDCADPEASWGHRKNNLLRSEDELFYGYYLSAGIMMGEENGPSVPEFARRAAVSACRHDPVRAFAPVLTALPGQGIGLGDILADSGYAHRDAAAWALPLRAAGAQLVQDLHPHDRGPKGTHDGAIIASGNLYCPKTPRSLLDLGPLARTATREQAADHDARTGEAARYKLGRITSDDADGYHRVQCPAAMGKIRCPLRPASMTLDRTGRRSSSPRSTPRPAARSRRSPSRRASSPRPRRSTTTRRRPGAAPTPAAPEPNAASPPSRTPPATTSPAAGAGSWDSPRSCCSPRPCSSSATSASWQPGTPGRKKTPAAPHGACPRKPADDDARPSPASPPDHPDPATATTTSPAPVTTDSSRTQAKARPETPKPRHPGAPPNPSNPAPGHGHQETRLSDQNVKIGFTET